MTTRVNSLKSALIGLGVGTAAVMLAGSLLIWPQVRARPWRADTVTANGGDIGVVMSGVSQTGEVRSFNGFRISYTVSNNTNADITLSSDSVVKVRRATDGALDDPPVPISVTTTFVPAHQRVRLHLDIPYPFVVKQREDLETALGRSGLLRKADGGF